MMQESFQSFLESTEFSHSLRMMNTRPNMFFIDVFLTVFTDNFVFSAKLRSVICKEIIISDFEEFLHPSNHGFISLISQPYCPSTSGAIIFCSKEWNTVKLGDICLTQLIWMSPFKSFPVFLSTFFRFNYTSSNQYPRYRPRDYPLSFILVFKANVNNLT